MSDVNSPRLDDAERAALRQRLEASRAVLLAALEGVTERDFTTNLGDGETVARMLARVAAEERAEVAGLRGETASVDVPARPLPPQVIHGLAGARYQTGRALEAPEVTGEAARALVERVEAREVTAAERIRNRPPSTPPPVIPVIQPPPG
ncbi:MAG: hypothetical protein O2919_08850 [Chloroflexi bacterium]|nr:hypothetical protein [Chloroflexota bacterium]